MSETTNLKLKKHDEPLNENTEQFNVRDYLNGNWDKIEDFAGQVNDKVIEIEDSIDLVKQRTEQAVEEINTDILNLDTNKASKAELQEATIALQAELKATRKDLQAGTLEGEDTGESLYLADSSDARFREFGIGGNSKQETREESNLYDKSTNITSKSINVSGEEVVSAGWAVTDYIAISAKNKLLKYNGLTAVGNNPHSAFYDSDKNFISSFKQATGENTIEIPENASYVRFTIEIASGDINTFNVSYVAMPSLQFSSEVKTVGQDVNIFDKNNATTLNAYVENTANTVVSSYVERIIIIPCEPNTTYTILKNIKTSIPRFRIDCASKNPVVGDTVTKLIYNTQIDKATATTTSDAQYLLLQMYSEPSTETVTREEVLNNIKIVKGTKINGYSPYNCGSANIVIENKNKLDFSKWNNATASHGTIEQVENGIKLTATANDCYTNTFAYKFQGTLNRDKIEYYGFIAKPNTKYTFSCKVNNIAISKRISMFFSDKDYNIISYVTSATSVLTATTPENCKYITIRVGVINTGDSLTFTDLQVEEGDAADYTAHEEQTFTISIQQEMLEGDCFEKVNGVWKEKHNWRKIILNGTESCVATADCQGRFLFDRIHNFTPLNHTRQKCTHSGANKAWGTTDKSFDVRDNRGAYINIPNITVEELKAKLAEDYANGTPLTFYFEVEPYYLDCTAEQIAILNEIEKTLHTYKNGTHVYCTDEISPIFNVKYTRDLNAVISNLSKQTIEGGN